MSLNSRAAVPRRPPARAGLIGAVALGAAAALIGGLALRYPAVALQASLRGVQIWWDVLFPALLPFFVLSELLLGFGIVHLAGKLLDPLMRPLFRLPGAGAFVVAMGFVSGYPVGARLTARLAEQRLVTPRQGERLVAMTTTSDPIFLIGAVCIGFFGNAHLAPLLAAAHYGGALLIGLLGGRSRAARDELVQTLPLSAAVRTTAGARAESGRLKAAIRAMHQARLADGRPPGTLLMQSLQTSLKLMMIVGGLVVLFSAMLDLLLASGLLVMLRDMTAAMLRFSGQSAALAPAYVNGTFEVTLGARAAAQGYGRFVPPVDQVAAAAFVLSWAGLSVHAQVAGLMGRAGWRYAPFARARLLHALLAAAIVYGLWPWLAA